MSIAERRPASETFAEDDIAVWINADQLQEITYDMIKDIVDIREKESIGDKKLCQFKEHDAFRMFKFDFKNYPIHWATRRDYTCNSDDTITIV